MNNSIHLSDLDPRKLLNLLVRHKSFITTLVVLSLFGFTGYQVSQITAIEPDAAYMSLKEKENKTTSLRVNKEALDQIINLKPSGDTSIPVNVGKSNPFSLN